MRPSSRTTRGISRRGRSGIQQNVLQAQICSTLGIVFCWIPDNRRDAYGFRDDD
jgi:hypothetical protein